MNKADSIRLRHMLEAALIARSFIEEKTRQSLDEDQLLVFGLIHAITLIGEAAAKITQETRKDYPLFPWTQMIGMRNVLIHRYFEIDLEQVWKTVTDDLPILIIKLEEITPPTESDTE